MQKVLYNIKCCYGHILYSILFYRDGKRKTEDISNVCSFLLPLCCKYNLNLKSCLVLPSSICYLEKKIITGSFKKMNNENWSKNIDVTWIEKLKSNYKWTSCGKKRITLINFLQFSIVNAIILSIVHFNSFKLSLKMKVYSSPFIHLFIEFLYKLYYRPFVANKLPLSVHRYKTPLR